MPIMAAIISWFTANAARLAIIGAFSMLLGIGIYMRGQENSALKCASSSSLALIQERKKDGKTHEKVMRMSGGDVDIALDEFVRPDD